MNATTEQTEHQVTLTKTVVYTTVITVDAVNADEALDAVNLDGTYDWVQNSEKVEATGVSPEDWASDED